MKVKTCFKKPGIYRAVSPQQVGLAGSVVTRHQVVTRLERDLGQVAERLVPFQADALDPHPAKPASRVSGAGFTEIFRILAR